MQTIKPRAIFVPSTSEYIVRGGGVLKIRPCLDAALKAWRERFFEIQLLPRS
jgi:hypothetical protein